MPEKEKLFEQFPPVSTGEWMNRVKADLKGQDFERKLVWKTIEGFSLNPFYRAEDIKSIPCLDKPPGEFPFLRGIYPGRNEWYVRQDINVKDPVKANARALDILNRGVTSLGFIFEEGTEYTSALMESLLKDIYCESIEINFLTQGKAKELFSAFAAYLDRKGVKAGSVRGALETDPLGRLMVNGNLCIPVNEAFDYLAGLVKSAGIYPNYRVLAVNGAAFGNAGSGVVQELAFSMAMGSEYLSGLTDRGISTDDAARSMGFTFGIGSNYFMEIARMRAARIMWAKIVEAYKPSSVEACKIYVHSVTGDWNKTIYDPYVNMLRTQTEAMSATLGGTNSLTVKPFDNIFREASEFSERIARNQQLLLMEESYFGRVNDPAAGSYYIEKLSSLIAEQAWKLFVAIEEEGGFLAGLQKGSIQEMVKETAALRKANIRKRKEKLLGTNIFPDEEDRLSQSYLKTEARKEKDSPEVEALTPFRAAEEFEALRMAVDRRPKAPVVFLLTIGNPLMRKARAQFAHGFFGCAGYKVIDNIGFSDPAEAVRAAKEEQADIVVVCSSDEEYADYVPRINNMLDGKSILVVAGEPPCMEDLRSRGIDHFISLRSNLLETLVEYNRELGIY
ncbi:MAG: acyl-CoA mutase large subunit family protein [Bacteroidales bacterium]|nr:acyl-CoA mutase large subunit family protein [Bacteroidales bacterium]